MTNYVQPEEDNLYQIKQNPLKYICSWAEDILPFTGKKIFEDRIVYYVSRITVRFPGGF